MAALLALPSSVSMGSRASEPAESAGASSSVSMGTCPTCCDRPTWKPEKTRRRFAGIAREDPFSNSLRRSSREDRNCSKVMKMAERGWSRLAREALRCCAISIAVAVAPLGLELDGDHDGILQSIDEGLRLSFCLSASNGCNPELLELFTQAPLELRPATVPAAIAPSIVVVHRARHRSATWLCLSECAPDLGEHVLKEELDRESLRAGDGHRVDAGVRRFLRHPSNDAVIAARHHDRRATAAFVLEGVQRQAQGRHDRKARDNGAPHRHRRVNYARGSPGGRGQSLRPLFDDTSDETLTERVVRRVRGRSSAQQVGLQLPNADQRVHRELQWRSRNASRNRGSRRVHGMQDDLKGLTQRLKRMRTVTWCSMREEREGFRCDEAIMQELQELR
eukprot:scaffold102_cov27-Tisochrysis_lutea.AAC.2